MVARVEEVRERGRALFLAGGAGGAWVNVSRFRPVALPDAGAHVRLKVDSKDYIVTLEDLSPPWT